MRDSSTLFSHDTKGCASRPVLKGRVHKFMTLLGVDVPNTGKYNHKNFVEERFFTRAFFRSRITPFNLISRPIYQQPCYAFSNYISRSKIKEYLDFLCRQRTDTQNKKWAHMALRLDGKKAHILPTHFRVRDDI